MATRAPAVVMPLQPCHHDRHWHCNRKHGDDSTDLNANNRNLRAVTHLLTLFDRLMKHMTASSLFASASALITPLAGVKVVSTSSSTRLPNVRGWCEFLREKRTCRCDPRTL